jgi:hypothetical protein
MTGGLDRRVGQTGVRDEDIRALPPVRGRVHGGGLPPQDSFSSLRDDLRQPERAMGSHGYLQCPRLPYGAT